MPLAKSSAPYPILIRLTGGWPDPGVPAGRQQAVDLRQGTGRLPVRTPHKDRVDQIVEFDIAPNAGPCCPLEILFLFDEVGYDAIAPIPVFVEVTG